MPDVGDQNLLQQLEAFHTLLERRHCEPDPFAILNVDRVESSYTHFLGWVLNPGATHPWKSEFLTDLLTRAEQPLPPTSEAMRFEVERFSFDQTVEDGVRFTHPDIVALAPLRGPTKWCMVIENKFDSKEGRAQNKATQCAMYETKARRRFAGAEFAFLFTTRSGERPLGGTAFTPIGYSAIADCFRSTRLRLEQSGQWRSAGSKTGDQYAYYLLDSFLDHLDYIHPKPEVQAALKALTGGVSPVGVDSEWLKRHPLLVAYAATWRQAAYIWDRDRMLQVLAEQGASSDEQDAFSAIYEWGCRDARRCDFNDKGVPGMAVVIPTCDKDARILHIQGRKMRFFWGHFVGYPLGQKNFPHARELANEYCEMLNHEFRWDLAVANDSGGYLEPAKALKDVARPENLAVFLKILAQVAEKALDE